MVWPIGHKGLKLELKEAQDELADLKSAGKRVGCIVHTRGPAVDETDAAWLASVAADFALECSLPVLDLNDADRIAAFITQRLSLAAPR